MNHSDFDADLLTPKYLANPYLYYRTLRENDPVHWSERMNAWILTRYDDVHAALLDQRLSSGARISAYADALPAESQQQLDATLLVSAGEACTRPERSAGR